MASAAASCSWSAVSVAESVPALSCAPPAPAGLPADPAPACWVCAAWRKAALMRELALLTALIDTTVSSSFRFSREVG